MKSERMAKRASFGNIVLKKLSDITNLQSVKVTSHEEKPPEISDIDKNSVDQLMKERKNLMKLITERNQIIELTGAELRNLRVSLQKLQLQNWNLAQSNSQMIAELNFGRERVKALQHELVCKEALLKAKNFRQEGKKTGKSHKLKCPQEGDEAISNVGGTDGTEKLRYQTRRRPIRSQSMEPLTTTTQKAEDKENVENKRRCLRRQSARYKSQERESTDNLFEIEDAQIQLKNNSINYQIGEEDEEEVESRRSSIGMRPLRRAVSKVQSYKEAPLNVKMRS